MSEPDFHCGYVAIVGRPNAGKSTLLNALLGQKISITSRRPQTTRQRITGILTRPDAQLVFIDTPGFQTQHRTTLTRLMNRAVSQSLHDADVVLWIMDALKSDEIDDALYHQLPQEHVLLIALNKIDRLARKSDLLNKIKYLNDRYQPRAIVPISAQNGHNLDTMTNVVASLLPVRERLYDDDTVTTASARFLAAEIVREKIFRLLGQELPYATAVEIERFEETATLTRIRAEILVDKPGQKSIVIGKGGEKLKAIGTQARRDLEKMLGTKVFLELWVKVRGAWADDQRTLRRLGME